MIWSNKGYFEAFTNAFQRTENKSLIIINNPRFIEKSIIKFFMKKYKQP